VVEHRDQAAPVLALVQPQNGSHEAAPAQPAPVAGDLQPVTRRLESLDDERRLSRCDIRDDPGHARTPG
jgi:hypothetical protein